MNAVHFLLPHFIVFLCLKVYDNFFTARVVSSFFALGSLLLIYAIAKNLFNRKTAILSALLFLFSITTLRFGGRFYLDQFGLFFFLLSLYFIQKNRFGLTGMAVAFSILARDYWIALYPFYLLYIYKRDRKGLVYFMSTSAVFLSAILWLILSYYKISLQYFMTRHVIWECLKVCFKNMQFIKLLPQLVRSWIELLISNFIIFAGFFYYLFFVKEGKAGYLKLIIPQFIILSLIYPFIVVGGLTHYPLALIGSISIFAGAGYAQLWNRILKDKLQDSIVFFMRSLLIIQFAAFNIIATSISYHGNYGLYALGYWNDKKVIDLLNEKVKDGEFVVGRWGGVLNKDIKWLWEEDNTAEIIESNPDWFITYTNRVTFKKRPGDLPEVELYEIGPFYVFHQKEKGHLGELIEPKEYPLWKFRKKRY